MEDTIMDVLRHENKNKETIIKNATKNRIPRLIMKFERELNNKKS